jgi:hypothetical protein
MLVSDAAEGIFVLYSIYEHEPKDEWLLFLIVELHAIALAMMVS